MAKIIKREWASTGPIGKRVKHVASGYTSQSTASGNGKSRRTGARKPTRSAALNHRHAGDPIGRHRPTA